MRAVALSRAKVIMPMPGTRYTTALGSRMFGTVGVLAAVVIGGVVRAIIRDRLVQAGDCGVEILGDRIERHHQRRDLGAQEMVGARGAHGGELAELARVHELQHHGLVVEVADLLFVAADAGADLDHQLAGDAAAVGLRQRLECAAPPKACLPRVSSANQRTALLMARRVTS